VEPFEFEPGVAEVDEQPNFDAGGFEIVDDLSLMFCRECARGL
jgi:hypothetical protein